ncbi:MAG: alpha/beta hydrolase [Rubrobacteraceae bacterium]|nr:alpha/beta hydrolase [Rubrobacteraceae bacterium]
MVGEGAHPGFVHRFIGGRGHSGVTLLLLHGTGGDESDLIPLGRELAPGASLLSVRGKVLENGLPRFFRRLAEGVFDQEDLRLRTRELAVFVGEASREYGFDPSRVVAVGYSNGANVAASVMLRCPQTLRAAVLLRAMVPFEPRELPDLSGRSVFLSAGRFDPMIPRESASRLAEILRAAGAEVELRWQEAGHGLTRAEIEEAGVWLRDGVISRIEGEREG